MSWVKSRRVRFAGQALAALALFCAVFLAIIWRGDVAKFTDPQNDSLWIIQNGIGNRYARLNLSSGELDTVREAKSPAGVANTAYGPMILDAGLSRISVIDQVFTKNLSEEEPDEFVAPPIGTHRIELSGDCFVFVTTSSEIHYSCGAAVPERLSVEGADSPGASAMTSIKLQPDNLLSVYYAESGEVLTFDLKRGGLLKESVFHVPGITGGQIVRTDSEVFLFLQETGELFFQDGAMAVALDLTGEVFFESPPGGELLAFDSQGILSINPSEGTANRLPAFTADRTRKMVPAEPKLVGGTIYAAWMGESEGYVWDSRERSARKIEIPVDSAFESQKPVIVSNGARAVLSEQFSGLVWLLPGGELVQSSKNWDEGAWAVATGIVVEEASRQVPPVANDDYFGVRAGKSFSLPVLLNDYDANADLISIVPGSVKQEAAAGLDLRVIAGKHVVGSLPEDAVGPFSFEYGISDGRQENSVSAATVHLEVIPEEKNSAPERCGTNECVSQTGRVLFDSYGVTQASLLEGWIDPEGDPIYAVPQTGNFDGGSFSLAASGLVTVLSDGGAERFSMELEVRDTRGAVAISEVEFLARPTGMDAEEFLHFAAVRAKPAALPVVKSLKGEFSESVLVSLEQLEGPGTRSRISENRRELSVFSEGQGSASFAMKADFLGKEKTVYVRVDFLDEEDSELAFSGDTVFASPDQEVVLDLIAMVSDPLRGVLLATDLTTTPVQGGMLQAQILDYRYLRIRGILEDGGAGYLGSVSFLITDGSESGNRQVVGELEIVSSHTVYEGPPLAMDDYIEVGPGELVEVFPIENDVSTSGDKLLLAPDLGIEGFGDGLAIVHGDSSVRILAPSSEGRYGIGYSSYHFGTPSKSASGMIWVEVSSDLDARHDGAPELEGRGVAGRSELIPISAVSGAKGRQPLEITAVKTQPEAGMALVSGDGQGIIFEAPLGVGGQFEFEYEARFLGGLRKAGTVRLGALGSWHERPPNLSSDYIQASTNTVSRHEILANDDGGGSGSLTLVSIEPNVPGADPLYQKLVSIVDSVDYDSGEIVLRAGGQPLAGSYIYRARDSRGGTHDAEVFVRIVEDGIPDIASVSDTRVGDGLRRELATGIDVLSDKVIWAAGDARLLRVSLAREEPLYRVEGNRIVGPTSPAEKIVPFVVSGESFAGEPMETIGFLIVLGEDENRIELRQEYEVISVSELETFEVPFSRMVEAPYGADLEVSRPAVRTGGARTNASCEITRDYVFRYTAGEGAPWRDYCVIPAGIRGLGRYTEMIVAIDVMPKISPPRLEPSTLTLSPGEETQLDVERLIVDGSVDFRAGFALDYRYSGDQFVVVKDGGALRIRALDGAIQGREEQLFVEVSHLGKDAATIITLKVGRAPVDNPRGGEVQTSCEASGSSTSCVVQLVGNPEEYNPFSNSQLMLEGLEPVNGCDGLSFVVASSTETRVSWERNTVGNEECSVRFIVADAQGRRSLGARAGSLYFQLHAPPKAPQGVNWVESGTDFVVLTIVDPHASFPSVTGYRVESATASQDCLPFEPCIIYGLGTGEVHNFLVRSISSYGVSDEYSGVTAWAFSGPAAPREVLFEPVVTADGRGGLVRLQIRGISPDSNHLTITGGLETWSGSVSGKESLETVYSVGSNTPSVLLVTTTSGIQSPPDGVIFGNPEAVLEVAGVHGVGAPLIESASAEYSASQGPFGELSIRATIAPNGKEEILVGVSLEDLECVPGERGLVGAYSREIALDRSATAGIKINLCAAHESTSGELYGLATWSGTVSIPNPDATREGE